MVRELTLLGKKIRPTRVEILSLFLMFNLGKIFIIIFISFINFSILAQRTFYNLNNNENFYLNSNKDTLYKSLNLKNACQFNYSQLSRLNKGAITDTSLLAFLIEKLYLPKNSDKSEPILRFEGGKEQFVIN
ncbi:MAG: hypothetical protein EAZ53_09610 [Bacteroidetes bacterium]|nr:MAG: hypothetical protein EAZ53_09610 [Bacteroidota bacterium]